MPPSSVWASNTSPSEFLITPTPVLVSVMAPSGTLPIIVELEDNVTTKKEGKGDEFVEKNMMENIEGKDARKAADESSGTSHHSQGDGHQMKLDPPLKVSHNGSLDVNMIDEEGNIASSLRMLFAVEEAEVRVPKEVLPSYINLVHDAISMSRNKERREKKGGPVLIPGFCLPKCLQPLLPVFLQCRRPGGDRIYGVFDNQLTAALKKLPFDQHLSINNVKKVVSEADGYQPHLIAPEQGYRRIIEGALNYFRGPSESFSGCLFFQVHFVLKELVRKSLNETQELKTDTLNEALERNYFVREVFGSNTVDCNWIQLIVDMDLEMAILEPELLHS
ncbi:hypothetical protein IFM89_006976 [Coptis chinensis]|uniref:Dynamin stalk domain-containing protein n=1 Tax=Coptis chinensis TaxID=261450 RepID=A0A835LLN2_9MAGN|nr:hypothetical protein IFM89_006976 [Coptis chinensis]